MNIHKAKISVPKEKYTVVLLALGCLLWELRSEKQQSGWRTDWSSARRILGFSCLWSVEGVRVCAVLLEDK